MAVKGPEAAMPPPVVAELLATVVLVSVSVPPGFFIETAAGRRGGIAAERRVEHASNRAGIVDSAAAPLEELPVRRWCRRASRCRPTVMAIAAAGGAPSCSRRCRA